MPTFFFLNGAALIALENPPPNVALLPEVFRERPPTLLLVQEIPQSGLEPGELQSMEEIRLG